MKKYIVLALIIVVTIGGVIAFKKYQDNKVTFVSGAPTPAPSGTPEPTTPISLVELKKHNKKSDCWISIDKSVYNMTSFISIHPGGADVMTRSCGSDASIVFNAEARHNSAVREQLKAFKIGIRVD